MLIIIKSPTVKIFFCTLNEDIINRTMMPDIIVKFCEIFKIESDDLFLLAKVSYFFKKLFSFLNSKFSLPKYLTVSKFIKLSIIVLLTLLSAEFSSFLNFILH